MKKTRKKATSDLRPEYRLDYGQSRPNRFAQRLATTSVAVVLDPDVASVFDSSESVNTLLRSVISALSEHKKEPKKKRASKGAA